MILIKNKVLGLFLKKLLKLKKIALGQFFNYILLLLIIITNIFVFNLTELLRNVKYKIKYKLSEQLN